MTNLAEKNCTPCSGVGLKDFHHKDPLYFQPPLL
jgi:hypothetical protein